MITRRSIVGAAFASGLAPALTRAETLSDREITALYRRTLVINGNLAGGYYEKQQLAPDIAAQFRRTGLTALKLSLGGDSENLSETIGQIDELDRAIAANADLFVRIRSAGDIRAAKRSGKIGIIASFESAAMLDGKVDAIDTFRARDVLIMALSYNLQTPFGSGMMVKRSTGLGRRLISPQPQPH